MHVGRYELLFPIASGGMADVWAARLCGDGGFQKPVALKRMHPHLARDEEFVKMFLDEGRLSAHVESPHVVQTLDLGRGEDGSLYLAMELVHGLSLSELLKTLVKKQARLPVDVAIEIVAQAATGLHHAHIACDPDGDPLRIVHRDVSPQNVLVAMDGRVRIADFGVAHAAERLASTAAGYAKGKYAYFSPEQAAGKHLDARSDVFALGTVAWEMLVLQRLFKADNPLATMDLIDTKEIPLASDVVSSVPRAVADVIARALARPLDERFESAAELARALRGAMGVLPGPEGIAAYLERELPDTVRELKERRSRFGSARVSSELVPVAAKDEPGTRKLSTPKWNRSEAETAPASRRAGETPQRSDTGLRNTRTLAAGVAGALLALAGVIVWWEWPPRPSAPLARPTAAVVAHAETVAAPAARPPAVPSRVEGPADAGSATRAEQQPRPEPASDHARGARRAVGRRAREPSSMRELDEFDRHER